LKNPPGADFRVSPVGAWRREASSKNGGTSLYRDGQEALVPRSAGMRESGHRRVLKNKFFSTLLDSAELLKNGISFVAVSEPLDSNQLFEEEKIYLGRSSEKRCQDFATGRWCARQALQFIGVDPVAIPMGKQREPVWPPGLVGSISHTKNYYCAGVSKTKKALGVDAERFSGELDEQLIKAVCSNAEYEIILSCPSEVAKYAPHVIFSAKEAYQKAVFPFIKKILNFDAVEIKIDWQNGSFDVKPSESVNVDIQLNGQFWIRQDIVLTMVWGESHHQHALTASGKNTKS